MVGKVRLWTVVACLALLDLAVPALAERKVDYITGTDVEGNVRKLRLDRSPALYTGDFGDCRGGRSLLNVTKHDAGIYTDNITVVFHLDGTTNIESEYVMIHIALWAYGEERFKMIFDPCDANIRSLCPMNASVPITAYGMWYLTPQQIESIPTIAYEIPDFDGYTRVQIFGNTTQSLVGCFQADMRNGNSFSHPSAIGSVFALVAVTGAVASFLAAAYGVSTTHMRSHYAHSLSVLLVLEAFQSIFFSGALSLRWPKVLPAWWSNFAWAAGIIPADSLVDSLDSFTGLSGNASQVGGAGAVVLNNNGGIFKEIYGRLLRMSVEGASSSSIARRSVPFNESDPYDYTWAGEPVRPGLPLPGSWFGFSGTLAALHVPASDAFMVGLVWLVVLLALVASIIVMLKFSLEAMAHFKVVRKDRLGYFRTHWIRYLVLAILRTLLVASIMIMTLSMYQFALRGAAGPTAVAAVVWIMFVVGMGGIVAYACFFRLRLGRYSIEKDRVELRRSKLWKVIPFPIPAYRSSTKEKEAQATALGSFAFPRIRYHDDDPSRPTVHQDHVYIKRFGWLSARYRRTRWWFFAFWLAYQFVRACFVGGGKNTPAAQVFGLLVLELVSFAAVVKLNPFEGRRNAALGVWMLGIAKILTTALSIAFLPSMGLSAIIATGIGIIIVVIQGLLVVGTAILVVLGCLSTWMSLSRNTEKFPDRFEDIRVRFYEHIEATAPDVPRPKEKKKGKEAPRPPEPIEPYFSVQSVRKAPKIEDEHGGYAEEMPPLSPSACGRDSRTNSLHSRYSIGSLPRGGRAHRTSWGSRDFSALGDPTYERPDSVLSSRMSPPGHSSDNPLGMQPLVEVERPPTAQSQLSIPSRVHSLRSVNPMGVRPTTPSRELLEKYSQERFSHIPGADK